MNSRGRENDISVHGLYIEKIVDLHCDLKGDFLKKLTFEDKFAIIENNSLKKKFQLP